jgi:hypothetical protein
MTELTDLHELVRTDPEAAWPKVVAFVREHPESAYESHDLIEDFVYLHDMQFMSRIELAAVADPVFREAVAQAYVGGFATNGAREFRLLQERFRLGAADPATGR